MSRSRVAERPVMVVVAGPPGSGKTTAFPVGAFGLDAFNIDDRCAAIVGSYRAISPLVRKAVSEECERFVSRHIEDAVSLAVETTLRTTIAIEQAARARANGFHTEMLFLCTDSPDRNIERVRQRALGGGHAASEGQIRAGYEAALRNLPAAITAFDRCVVYDSSRSWSAPREVALAVAGKWQLGANAPEWVRTAARQG